MTFLRSRTVHQLGEGAGLALDAFRLMAIGADASALVAAFDARLGPPGRAALAFGGLFKLARLMIEGAPQQSSEAPRLAAFPTMRAAGPA